jgi:predicted MPP superfamily phosphohydrolase
MNHRWRLRRRRFYLWAQGVTALAHIVPTLGLAAVLPWPIAVVTGVALCASIAARFLSSRPDGRRGLWVTRLVDEPLCCQWAASLLSLPLFIPSLLSLALLSRVGGVPAFGLRTSALVAYGAALALAVWGVWVRRRLVVVRRLELPITGLSSELDGYRIAQLSDLHIGNFDRRATAARWVARTNALQPNLVVVTGDLVTTGTEFYSDVAEALSGLNAEDGVICILGNHDQWDDARCRALLSAQGLTVLSNGWRAISKSTGTLVIAGLDDPYTGKANLEATLRGRPEGAPTILLSHYPEWFDAAVEYELPLVLSGHTHGGQLGVPFLADRLNLATLTGQRSRGLFRKGASLLYVHAGLGTTGPPIRLGVPPEIALFTLRAALANPGTSA